MHVDNQIQKMECIETIKLKGEKIMQIEARKRDKMLAVSYCLVTNGYTEVNTIHGTWRNMKNWRRLT